MGMIGYLKRIPEPRLSSLIHGGEDLYAYIHGEEGGELDLDKAWQGLHYLLCGDAFSGEGPLFDALMGGKPLNEDETEEIIVRYLTPDEVRNVAAALESVGRTELARGFEPDDMNEANVYPAQDWNDEGELDYLLGYYEPMRDHYRAAAAAGEGMLLYVA
ncbi:YfbM family protein [Saccharibacillus alkalitolerans]|uniref:YfbM family protein n=1 Tax=Saccharibacillus alkalitolerans TaxID=2705290 RepID=A0ABX0F8W2_9BACL|nr:YfbM family protein [Saccharibacillus alkalitolerans]NGZ76753.1 YfbM family protein [Saccharibacillus alkalitolerans]